MPSQRVTGGATLRTHPSESLSSAAQTVATQSSDNLSPGVSFSATDRPPQTTTGAATPRAQLSDVLGNPLVTLPTEWPLARPTLASRDERIKRVELRRAYAWAIQSLQEFHGANVLPPCTWCGMPTGGWCDFCIAHFAKAVCSDCGGTDATILAACRNCTAELSSGTSG